MECNTIYTQEQQRPRLNLVLLQCNKPENYSQQANPYYLPNRPHPSCPPCRRASLLRCRVVECRIYASIVQNRVRQGRCVAHVGGDIPVSYSAAVRPGIDLPFRLPYKMVASQRRNRGRGIELQSKPDHVLSRTRLTGPIIPPKVRLPFSTRRIGS